MTKEQLLEKLQSSEELIKMAYLPLHEVINWVKELDESKPSISDEQISDIANSIAESISDMGIDALDDYDLTMNYREVELDSIEFNTYEIKKRIESELQDNWNILQVVL